MHRAYNSPHKLLNSISIHFYYAGHFCLMLGTPRLANYFTNMLKQYGNEEDLEAGAKLKTFDSHKPW